MNRDYPNGGGNAREQTSYDKKAHWKIERTINPSHIIAVSAYILAAIVLWVKMDSRISLLESAQARYDGDSKTISDVKVSVRVIESQMIDMAKNQEKLTEKVDELIKQGRR